MHIEKGMRVIVRQPKQGFSLTEHIGKTGTVIGVHGGSVCVEFDEDVGGHDGNNSTVQGKEGHCWWLVHIELEPFDPMDNQAATVLLKEE